MGQPFNKDGRRLTQCSCPAIRSNLRALPRPIRAMANSASGLQSLPALQRVLVVGSGGREHARVGPRAAAPGIEKVGQSGEWRCSGSRVSRRRGLLPPCDRGKRSRRTAGPLPQRFGGPRGGGPEAPLAAGLADHLRDAGVAVFGPSADGAQLEASKARAKQLMQEASIPTAGHWSISSADEGLAVLEKIQRPLVVKADGLAAGKGVTVATSVEESANAIREAFGGRFGTAGDRVVLEECLQGPEVSVFALCDGERMVILPPAQDHKRLLDGDQGPNTGGMGAYAPAPLLDGEGLATVRQLVLEPTVKALRERGINYRGVIYAGLMLTQDGPQVIEYNCRFGDPECQTLMPLMGPELGQVLQACALGRLDLAPTLTIKADRSVLRGGRGGRLSGGTAQRRCHPGRSATRRESPAVPRRHAPR